MCALEESERASEKARVVKRMKNLLCAQQHSLAAHAKPLTPLQDIVHSTVRILYVRHGGVYVYMYFAGW